MSAVVTVDYYRQTTVEVPKVDTSAVDKDGGLHLSVGYCGIDLAVFRPGKWEFVVITPERDNRGRFVSKP